MDRLFRESLELFSAREQEPPAHEQAPSPAPPEQKPVYESPRQAPPSVPPTSTVGAPGRVERQPDLHAAVEKVLKQFPDLPAQSALLGLGEDRLPVLLDLQDPTPGALLVMGDERDAQIALLQSIIASTAGRNTARSVQIVIISHQPELWSDWTTEHGYARHCAAILSANDEAVSQWVLRLADWTEQRRLGQRSGPAVILLVDTLSFLQKLTYDVRLNFDWMVKEGPPAMIWPVAAISFDLADSLGQRALRVFGSQIVGYARDPQKAARLAQVSDDAVEQFSTRGRFAIAVEGQWLAFTLPGRG